MTNLCQGKNHGIMKKPTHLIPVVILDRYTCLSVEIDENESWFI